MGVAPHGSIGSQLLNQTFANKDLAARNGCKCLSVSVAIPLLIIGVIGACGYLSSSFIGWSAIGLSVPMALANCSGGLISCFKEEKSDSLELSKVISKWFFVEDVKSLVSSLAIVALGILTISGTLPPITLGWCLIAKCTLSCTISCCALGCIGMSQGEGAKKEGAALLNERFGRDWDGWVED